MDRLTDVPGYRRVRHRRKISARVPREKVEFSEVHRSNPRPIAPVLWPRTGPRRNFFSIPSTVATIVTRIRCKWLRLATVRSSENFLR